MHPIGNLGNNLNICDYFVFGFVEATTTGAVGAGGGMTIPPGLNVVIELGITGAVCGILKGIAIVCFSYF